MNIKKYVEVNGIQASVVKGHFSGEKPKLVIELQQKRVSLNLWDWIELKNSIDELLFEEGVKK